MIEHLAMGPTPLRSVDWLFLIPLFPLLGAAGNFLAGARLQRRFGPAAIHSLSIAAVLLSAGATWIAFARLLALPPAERFLEDRLWTLFRSGSLVANLGFAVDPLAVTLMLIITNIGALIHIYSVGYMRGDGGYWRFFAWLNLFVFAMLLLVMGDNFVLLFFGWEGVGLCSWGLISFWYQDLANARAGMKAFIVNRIGDMGFLAGIFLLFWSLGGVWVQGGRRFVPERPISGSIAGTFSAGHSLPVSPDGIAVGPTIDFRQLRDQIATPDTHMAERLGHMQVWGMPVLFLICLLLFIGATGKSAQIPLYVWLPDAMAGPTPVSALIHAATMVTAGVYMVARLNFLFALSPMAMGLVACIGALTALFAALVACFQHDIKKVLAYSTISQLGYMFIGVGVGAYWAGVYHLFTHAFFKACLFLAAGSVIIANHHQQDMRRLGGLWKRMPITAATYLLACMAIAGLPWMSGFYSKDEILWRAFVSRSLALPGLGGVPWLGPAIWATGLLAAFGTAYYMFRSFYLTFSGDLRGTAPSLGAAHSHDTSLGADPHTPGASHAGEPRESPPSMTIILAVLAAGAFLALFLGLPSAWGFHPLFESWLAPSLQASVHFAHRPRLLEAEFGALSVGVALLGWGLAHLLYFRNRSSVPQRAAAAFPRLWKLLYNKFYIDEIYGILVAMVRLIANLDSAVDKYVIDGLVNLVGSAVMAGGRAARRLQTGRIQTYLYGALGGALAIVILQYVFQKG